VEVAVVASDREAAEAVARAATDADPESDASIGEERGLAGDAAQWVMFAGVVRGLVPVLETILWQVGLGRVTRIKVGDVEIENPRREDVERLLDRHRASPE
jgi:hypothetical protein